MILNAQSIADRINQIQDDKYRLSLIERYANINLQLQSASFDLRLNDTYKMPRAKHGTVSPIDFDTYDAVMEFKETVTDRFILMPSEFVLASTIEWVNLPNDLSAFVEGRSSIGRTGLFIHNAGWIDPGFRGTITLELFNAAPYPLVLDAGRRICQIVFQMLNQETFDYAGKYQNEGGTIPSRINEDV